MRQALQNIYALEGLQGAASLCFVI